jgi:hypothetical protein
MSCRMFDGAVQCGAFRAVWLKPAWYICLVTSLWLRPAGLWKLSILKSLYGKPGSSIADVVRDYPLNVKSLSRRIDNIRVHSPITTSIFTTNTSINCLGEGIPRRVLCYSSHIVWSTTGTNSTTILPNGGLDLVVGSRRSGVRLNELSSVLRNSNKVNPLVQSTVLLTNALVNH